MIKFPCAKVIYKVTGKCHQANAVSQVLKTNPALVSKGTLMEKKMQMCLLKGFSYWGCSLLGRKLLTFVHALPTEPRVHWWADVWAELHGELNAKLPLHSQPVAFKSPWGVHLLLLSSQQEDNAPPKFQCASNPAEKHAGAQHHTHPVQWTALTHHKVQVAGLLGLFHRASAPIQWI